jgi:hypothetical protein
MLDTCVLVSCTLLNLEGADPDLLATMSDRIREKGLQLLLPAVVEMEYSRKAPEELDRIKQQTDKFREEVTTQLLPATDVSALHHAIDQLASARAAAAKRGQEYVSRLAADAALTVRVPLTGEILSDAVTCVLAGRKPFKAKRQADWGLLDPDCLIIASIASFARSRGLTREDAILICSDNHRDFGAWNGQTKRYDIASDIEEAIPCSVRYYKSPRALLEEELDLAVQEDRHLAQALDNYDGVAKMMASVTSGIARDYSLALETVMKSLSSNMTAIDRSLLGSLPVVSYAELLNDFPTLDKAKLLKAILPTLDSAALLGRLPAVVDLAGLVWNPPTQATVGLLSEHGTENPEEEDESEGLAADTPDGGPEGGTEEGKDEEEK